MYLLLICQHIGIFSYILRFIVLDLCAIEFNIREIIPSGLNPGRLCAIIQSILHPGGSRREIIGTPYFNSDYTLYLIQFWSTGTPIPLYSYSDSSLFHHLFCYCFRLSPSLTPLLPLRCAAVCAVWAPLLQMHNLRRHEDVIWASSLWSLLCSHLLEGMLHCLCVACFFVVDRVML